MTFLSKLGSIALKIGQIITGFNGLVPAQYQPAAVKVASELEQLAGVIQTVEIIGQRLQIPGPQKLTAAAPLVAQAILQSALMADKKIANQDLFSKACTEIAGGMADLLNSLEDKVPTVDKT